MFLAAFGLQFFIEFSQMFVEEDGGADCAVEGGDPMQVYHAYCWHDQQRNSAEK
jgi:hypothetical protein